MTFGHTADEDTVRTGLLQTGTCNLASLPERDTVLLTENSPQDNGS